MVDTEHPTSNIEHPTLNIEWPGQANARQRQKAESRKQK
jgi:hypothetical protein